jgi:hypothetical protein
MHRAQFIEREQKIAAERLLQWKGSAQVKIALLRFPGNNEKSREVDVQHTKKLTKLLESENEQNIWQFRNRIPAVVDQHQLEEALAASGISAERLMDTRDCPELDFPTGFQLECLHGQHRIKAAARINPNSRWTVDFYLAGQTSAR